MPLGRRPATRQRIAPPAPNFSCDRRNVAGLAVVEVAGDLDLSTAPILQRALGAAIDSGPAPVIVDMRHLEFMDCAGLNAIDSQPDHDRLHLVHPTGEVRRVLELTDYDRTLHIYDTLEEATAAATQSSDVAH
jgi:anti-sigma B factor antagonist